MNIPIFIKAGRGKLSITKEVREVNRLRIGFERGMSRSLVRHFNQISKSAASEYKRTQTVSASLLTIDDDLGKIFRSYYTQVIETFADRVYSNRKLERFNQLIFQYYEKEGASKVALVSNTTRRQIKKAIDLAEVDGLGVDETAKFIVDRTSGAIARSRAATIARTETHAAASYATDTATRELNLPNQKKRWVAVGDARTRPSHAAANGQEVLIDEAFLIRDKGAVIAMKYPHDGNGGASNNINCRCLAVYFTDDDDLFDDLVGAEDIQDAPIEQKPTIDLLQVTTGRGVDARDYQDTLNKELTPLSARVVDKLPKPKTILVKKKGGSFYQRSRQEIQSTIEHQMATHEYGHHVDYMIGRQGSNTIVTGYWSKNALKDAFKADRKLNGVYRVSAKEKRRRLLEIRRELFDIEVKDISYVNSVGDDVENTIEVVRGQKFEGAYLLSDIIDGFVSGEFRSKYNTFGHSKSYWANRRSHAGQAESFANIFGILNQKEAAKYAEKNFPNMWAIIIKKLQDLDADGNGQ